MTALSTAFHRFTCPGYLRQRYDYHRDGAYSIQRNGDGWSLTKPSDYYPSHDCRNLSASEVASRIRSDIAARKSRVGRQAAHACWESLCDHYAALARETRTAADLLRIPRCRELVQSMGARDHTANLDYYAKRSAQREARDLLAARAARRSDRRDAEAARDAQPIDYAARLQTIRANRAAATERRDLRRLAKGTLTPAGFARVLPSLLEVVSDDSDRAIRMAVSLVGEIGDQAEDDLRAMATDESFSGKRGRNHKLTRTVLHRVEARADWTAALITMRDYCSYGSSRWGGDTGDYGSRGGSSYRCYLVVRDATRGTAHILRVPPKFGNEDTQFFHRFEAASKVRRGKNYRQRLARQATELRIAAAVDWTFSDVGYRSEQAVEA